MATDLATIIADFQTQLATALAVGGTSATLQSATDDDGVVLPSGRYFFTLDGDNSNKEHIVCDLASTALTNIKSVSRQGVEASGVVRKHRVGATVTITDFKHIRSLNDLLSGAVGFDSATKIGYDADPALVSGDTTKFATVKYVNDTTTAGAPDATTSIKGIGKVSVAPASPTSPIFVGDNDPRVPTQDENDALVGFGTPSPTNKYETAFDTSNLAVKTATTIAFVNSNPDTITDSGNGFVTAGFYAGQSIIITGSASNNGTFTIASVVAGTITLVASDSLTAESAGATVTITAAKNNKLLRLNSSGVYPAGDGSAITGLAKTADIQTFTANGTWSKPTGAKAVLVKMWGGGGGGGGGIANAGGGGGGGGAYKEWTFDASDLSSTEAIVVGAGGAGGAADTVGVVGGNSSLGSTKIVAYGGGGGAKTTGQGGGGGGGGHSSAGTTATSSTGGDGGGLIGGTGGAPGTTSNFGGGGGGAGSNSGSAGGLSVLGGGGGGGGATNVGAPGNGNVGGLSFYGGGGGGGGGGSSGGAGGASTRAGAGGAGATSSGTGTAGTIPAGGGGGGAGATGAGGAGARGLVVVITYF